MMRTSLVLPVVAIVLAGSSPAHSATPNALNIAPEKPKIVARLRRLMSREHTASEFYPIHPLD